MTQLVKLIHYLDCSKTVYFNRATFPISCITVTTVSYQLETFARVNKYWLM